MPVVPKFSCTLRNTCEIFKNSGPLTIPTGLLTRSRLGLCSLIFNKPGHSDAVGSRSNTFTLLSKFHLVLYTKQTCMNVYNIYIHKYICIYSFQGTSFSCIRNREVAVKYILKIQANIKPRNFNQVLLDKESTVMIQFNAIRVIIVALIKSLQ